RQRWGRLLLRQPRPFDLLRRTLQFARLRRGRLVWRRRLRIRPLLAVPAPLRLRRLGRLALLRRPWLLRLLALAVRLLPPSSPSAAAARRRAATGGRARHRRQPAAATHGGTAAATGLARGPADASFRG